MKQTAFNSTFLSYLICVIPMGVLTAYERCFFYCIKHEAVSIYSTSNDEKRVTWVQLNITHSLHYIHQDIKYANKKKNYYRCHILYTSLSCCWDIYNWSVLAIVSFSKSDIIILHLKRYNYLHCMYKITPLNGSNDPTKGVKWCS